MVSEETEVVGGREADRPAVRRELECAFVDVVVPGELCDSSGSDIEEVEVGVVFGLPSSDSERSATLRDLSDVRRLSEPILLELTLT